MTSGRKTEFKAERPTIVNPSNRNRHAWGVLTLAAALISLPARSDEQEVKWSLDDDHSYYARLAEGRGGSEYSVLPAYLASAMQSARYLKGAQGAATLTCRR